MIGTTASHYPIFVHLGADSPLPSMVHSWCT